MLLEQLLSQPSEQPNLLYRASTYPEGRTSHLVRDIIALANSDHGAARYIIFGVERPGDKDAMIGLGEEQLALLRQQNRDLARLIEPSLEIAPVYAQVNGKIFAAVEISACDNPPYVAREDVSQSLRRGECWVIGNAGIRPAQREDFDRMYARSGIRDEPLEPVSVGLGEDLDCRLMTIAIPDRSALPSQIAVRKLKQSVEARRSARSMLGHHDTGIARLVHARLHGNDVPFDPSGTATLVEEFRSAKSAYRDADEHYLYEQRAIRLNLVLCNNGEETLRGAVLELSLPRVPGFDVADRIHHAPGDEVARREAELMGYPLVRKTKYSARVIAELGDLEQKREQPVFDCPLRLAIGPEMKDQKIALRYAIAASGLDEPLRGRLKLKFRV